MWTSARSRIRGAPPDPPPSSHPVSDPTNRRNAGEQPRHEIDTTSKVLQSAPERCAVGYWFCVCICALLERFVREVVLDLQKMKSFRHGNENNLDALSSIWDSQTHGHSASHTMFSACVLSSAFSSLLNSKLKKRPWFQHCSVHYRKTEKGLMLQQQPASKCKNKVHLFTNQLSLVVSARGSICRIWWRRCRGDRRDSRWCWCARRRGHCSL